MGYRSDVAIELQDKAFEKMKNAFDELATVYEADFDYCRPFVKKFCKSTTVISFERIKWLEYNGFVEVDAVIKVLDDIDEEHRGE